MIRTAAIGVTIWCLVLGSATWPRAELINNALCENLAEALDIYREIKLVRYYELTAADLLILKKLEEWWHRAGCDKIVKE